MALLMSLIAFNIDAMLPALETIGEAINIEHANDRQLIVSMAFLGMAPGMILYGPLSDAIGRKPAVLIGIGIYLVGSVICIIAGSLSVMLIGRILQGFGGASCRIISTAMIRDKFEGPEMARVMSLMMMIFILVPVLAPSVGQVVIMFAPWEAIFILCLLLGMVSGVWLVLRQPETLAMENKRDFTLVALWQGVKETLSHPMSRSYTICAGLVFGAFIGYLSTSQQVFQDQYGMGAKFPFFFGGLALVIGVASFVNSKLVMVFGMEELSIGAVGVMALASLGLIIANVTFSVEIDIFICTAYFSITFFGMGILFGNFNALALAPLGHMAGVANSVIS